MNCPLHRHRDPGAVVEDRQRRCKQTQPQSCGNPPGTAVVGEGDGVVLIGRPNRAAILTSLFEPRERLGPRG